MATGILKKDVRTEDDLLQYLKEKVSETKRFYHYTTFDSLLAILNGKSFRLSRTSLLNDKKEREFSGTSDSYVMSLTCDKEYVSMWSMYGKSSGIKIRIDFSKELFLKCFVEANIYSDAELKTHYFDKSKSSSPVAVSACAVRDIVYLDKTRTEYRHRENPFPNIVASEAGILNVAGFIKYDAWEFEREIRARVMASTALLNYVFVKLSDEFLESIQVTFNPWISPNMKREIEVALKARGVKCNNSDFDGQIDEL